MSLTAAYTWTVGEQVTAAKMNQHLRDNLKAILPLGAYLMVPKARTAVETLVEGFLLEANGVNVSRTTYSDLNALYSGLSYPHGSGDGSTTFGIPDGAGRQLVALGSHTDIDGIGENEGVALAARRPRHKHSGATLPNHVHSMTQPQYLVQDFTAGSTIALRADTNVSGSSAPNSVSAAVGNPTSNPAIAVGPQTGNEPTDSEAYIVGGVWCIRAKY